MIHCLLELRVVSDDGCWRVGCYQQAFQLVQEQATKPSNLAASSWDPANNQSVSVLHPSVKPRLEAFFPVSLSHSFGSWNRILIYCQANLSKGRRLCSSLGLSRQTPPLPLNPQSPRTKQHTITHGRICKSQRFKILQVILQSMDMTSNNSRIVIQRSDHRLSNCIGNSGGFSMLTTVLK